MARTNRKPPSRAAKPIVQLVITSGDANGIGLEVTRKALEKIGPQRGVSITVLCDSSASSTKEIKKLRSFSLHLEKPGLGKIPELLGKGENLHSSSLRVLQSSESAALWVEATARYALENSDSGLVTGLVTGPVAKSTFRLIDSTLVGHTGLLSRLSGVHVSQGYVGTDLQLVLATDHIPLNQVQESLTPAVLNRALQRANGLRLSLSKERMKLPMAILGLNPHAGEDGTLGDFERRVLSPWVSVQNKRLPLVGPLPPDTAFTTDSRRQYSVIIALYHDQGLIPFKTLYGQNSGYQISLGLPFVRTSVDHGTAIGIHGKNRANPGSMISAINGAIAMLKNCSKGTRYDEYGDIS